VSYIQDWSHPDEKHRSEYEKLQARFTGGIRSIEVNDSDAANVYAMTPVQTTTLSPEARF